MLKIVKSTYANNAERNSLAYKVIFNDLVNIYRNEMKRNPEPGSLIQQTREWEYPWVLEQIQFKDNMDILDIGAGASPLPLMLGRMGMNVYCVDAGDMGVGNENKLWGYCPEYATDRVKYFNMNAEHDMYAKLNKQFDVILSIGALEHMTNPQAVRNQLDKLIKPDGVIILTWDVPKDEKRLDRLNYHCDVLAEVLRVE